MLLQEFVDSLSAQAFRGLMDACIVRLEKENKAAMAAKQVLTYAEQRLVELGEKISVIKSVKDRLGLDLRGAKDLVDGVIATLSK